MKSPSKEKLYHKLVLQLEICDLLIIFIRYVMPLISVQLYKELMGYKTLENEEVKGRSVMGQLLIGGWNRLVGVDYFFVLATQG